MENNGVERFRIRIYGVVQGVGFRPFVYNLAVSLGICGSVCNKGSFVEIIAQGGEHRLAAFLRMLKSKAPPRSDIRKIETTSEKPEQLSGFRIVESARAQGEVFVSPDIGICGDCKRELFDQTNPRYLHPFINCTACGPRLTILDAMPYDRARTSMGKFEMCDFCAEEYKTPSNRRYHAQPVCCPDCGPRLYALKGDGGENVITAARKVIREGGIVAIKGIGGFHLCCDAADSDAVSRLRGLKGRPFKPFAVMAKDLETARRECIVEDSAVRWLDGPEKPIVLLRRRKGGLVCENAAPGNPRLGIMLPYAPVHLLIFDYPDGLPFPACLVMTSGNRSGAPICINDGQALEQLSGLCDLIVSHDRDIRMRADDSVMTLYNGKPYMIRRSRGFSPLPLTSECSAGSDILAVGGELKNAFCLMEGKQFYLSPHVGDLTDPRGVEALGSACERLAGLLAIKPKTVVCDLSPAYNSAAYARGLGLPVITVQHHFAHIVSCMAENKIEGPVIGVAFDGTGYGPDGTVWGGEFLKASYLGFERLGSIQPFLLAGGDRAALEPWRPAVSLLFSAYGGDEEKTAAVVRNLALCSDKQLGAQLFMLRNGVNCAVSTSVGRVFDAVSAILGLKKLNTFEGEAAIALETAALGGNCASGSYHPEVSENIPFAIDIQGMIKYCVERFLSGCAVSGIAAWFHAAMAQAVAAGCEKCRALTSVTKVALSGGVFANLTLLDLCGRELRERGFTVFIHHFVPPNDGGIALGQAAAAARMLGSRE